MVERGNLNRGEASRREIQYQQVADDPIQQIEIPVISQDPATRILQSKTSLPDNRQIFAASINAKKPPSVRLPACDWCDPLHISRSLIAAADADMEVEEVLAEEQGRYLQSASLQNILDTGFTEDRPEGFTIIDEDDAVDPLLQQEHYLDDVIGYDDTE